MIEFGSDFHYIDSYYSGLYHLTDYCPNAVFFADGRQCFVALIRQCRWKRIWIPYYFCYEVIENIIRSTHIAVIFYDDDPINEAKVDCLPFKDGDVLIRMNYFGMRGFRSNDGINIPVIEDHSHSLIGDWAIKSDADWCIASLRKTLPISEGGILWSPKRLQLPKQPNPSGENEEMASKRWGAMKLKSQYLNGEAIEKSAFRQLFIDTEEYFDRADVCALDHQGQEYLSRFNIREWYDKKRENWELLRDIKKDGVRIVCPEGMGCYLFSLVLLFNSHEERDRVRKELIARQVYPAVLWPVLASKDGDIFKFSQEMLSIHCDARYTKEDILQMKSIIESVL